MPDQNKQEEILKAASKCFAQYGFAKTTMDDIGKMVGLNKASLYYYYKNKEAIFCEIITREREKFLCSLTEKIDSIDTWHEKIQVYILERQRYSQKTINLHKLSIKTSEQLQFQPIFRKLLKHFTISETKIIRKILDQALEDKQICPVDTKKAASAILLVANGIKQQQMLLQNHTMNLAQFDFNLLENETRFAISLLLKGLTVEGRLP